METGVLADDRTDHGGAQHRFRSATARARRTRGLARTLRRWRLGRPSMGTARTAERIAPRHEAGGRALTAALAIFDARLAARPDDRSALYGRLACLFGLALYRDGLATADMIASRQAAAVRDRWTDSGVASAAHSRLVSQALVERPAEPEVPASGLPNLEFSAWSEQMLGRAVAPEAVPAAPHPPPTPVANAWTAAGVQLTSRAYSEALRLYEAALGSGGGYPQPWVGIGSALLGLGMTPAAKVAYLQALSIPPFLWESVVGLAVCDLHDKRFDLAEIAFAGVPAWHREWGRAQSGLFRAYVGLGQWRKALARIIRERSKGSALCRTS